LPERNHLTLKTESLLALGISPSMGDFFIVEIK